MSKARISHEQARADHEYLWAIAPADDMTGGYVDQEDLYRLMRCPTKATARGCYVSQIRYWFDRGPGRENIRNPDYTKMAEGYPGLRAIADRYGIDTAWDGSEAGTLEEEEEEG